MAVPSSLSNTHKETECVVKEHLEFMSVLMDGLLTLERSYFQQRGAEYAHSFEHRYLIWGSSSKIKASKRLWYTLKFESPINKIWGFDICLLTGNYST
jgi:hypothetical protein